MKDKDIVMLTIAGLREEYYGLKSTLLTRTPPVTFGELHALISDHDYMITKLLPTQSATSQALLATVQPQSTQPNLQSLQNQLNNLQLLATQLGQQLNPTASASSPLPQAYFAPRSSNPNRGGRGSSRGTYRGNSRNNNNARNRDTTGSRQFSWASTQNTVFGHCNRCGIGHLPSQCPNHSSQSRIQSQAHYAHHSDNGSHRIVGYYDPWSVSVHLTETRLFPFASASHR
ncbi:hypothetical protein E3N88_21446 [Mikania micrantha]|uniref:Uncharacterized protein n=1 Tax=Mikania micrantha TaxID=192012 RepID=A0A5N6NLP6_9ASTR|nr:hypothetical protein E3N88_21446 [Mikania micrantha]